ncbi:hypothetical protein FKP32DRAFT_127424 [Trametes sanguinea]|nr:hypothetical protein FKP32DRAFT_127424 [Trametes sanguinea]
MGVHFLSFARGVLPDGERATVRSLSGVGSSSPASALGPPSTLQDTMPSSSSDRNSASTAMHESRPSLKRSASPSEPALFRELPSSFKRALSKPEKRIKLEQDPAADEMNVSPPSLTHSIEDTPAKGTAAKVSCMARLVILTRHSLSPSPNDRTELAWSAT